MANDEELLKSPEYHTGVLQEIKREQFTRRLYAMKLHDTLDGIDMRHETEGSTTILRVPGGWIYTVYCQSSVASVFVPWDNQFQPK